MILTCPQCASRFLLPATLLAPEGRHVKCSNCGEVWEQLPDPEELEEFEAPEGVAEEGGDESSEDQPPEQAFEEIPEAVKPIPEGSSVPAVPEDEPGLKDKILAPLIVALSSSVLVLIVLLVLFKPVVNALPSTAPFYEVFGLTMAVPGEGLIFDNLYAEARGKSLVLRGTVINLTNKKQKLPYIEAVIRDESGADLEVWGIAPPVNTIAEEGEEVFSITIIPEHKAGYDIHLQFVGKPSDGAKTALANAGSTHAPPSDDHTH